MRWVTRRGANVDRIACPWLIRRFIDADAEFVFVPEDTDPSTIAEGVPFDMAGVELGHVDDRCSFESFIAVYGLDDRALGLMASIIHGADSPVPLPTSPSESRGLRAIAFGFSHLHGANDLQKIELETPMYDALYAWCQGRVASA